MTVSAPSPELIDLEQRAASLGQIVVPRSVWNDFWDRKRLQESGLRAMVVQFADAMEQRLHANAYKGDTWRDMAPSWLFRRLRAETNELMRANQRDVDAHKILSEAADVANFAMFVWDKARHRLRSL